MKNQQLKYWLTDEASAANLPAPSQALPGDAGYDLRSVRRVTIPPQTGASVATGVGFGIPEGWYGLICNRTSWGKKGLLPLAHVVDTGFTGELQLWLFNTNPTETLVLDPGQRIAQIVFMPFLALEAVRVEKDDLETTARGARGFGSTGNN